MDRELQRRLAAARGYAGLSQEHFAKKLRLSRSTISRLESENPPPGAMEEAKYVRLAARVCDDLPVGFFYAEWSDFGSPEMAGDGWRAEIERRVLKLERATRLDVAEGEAQELEDQQPPNGDQLSEEDEPGPPMAGEG